MKTVTIAGLAVELSTPYAAGHTLNEAEAKTLNQVRIENIRNNSAKAVKEAGDDAAKAVEAQPFVRSGDKVGRNDPCPCGSGKKYKQCHGRLA